MWTLLKLFFALPLFAVRVLWRRVRGAVPARWTFLFALANEALRWIVAGLLGRLIGGHFRQLPMPRLRGWLARETEQRPATLAGCAAEWHIPRAAPDGPCILYLHGGGFVTGSLGTHRRLMARLAVAAKARVVGIDYRLAPAHPFPAGLDDCVAAYRALLDSGESPGRLFIGGDSAGGGLTVSTLLRLKQEGLPMPAGALGLSPAVDLADLRGSWDENAPFDFLAPLRDHALTLLPAYLGPEGDPTLPLVSPINADLSGLPPLLLHVGSREVLRDQVVDFAERARQAGVDVVLDVAADMVHVFHAFFDVQPDADEAIERIGAFVRARAGAQAPQKNVA
ncbi:MAG: alpha/beta hydrolase [Myxococcota bacterium]